MFIASKCDLGVVLKVTQSTAVMPGHVDFYYVECAGTRVFTVQCRGRPL